MGVLRRADFYYGSMLSYLINRGLAPAIIEPGEDRRIYSLSTNHGDFQIYAKYLSVPARRQGSGVKIWNFSFTPDEVKSIKEHLDGWGNMYFALICGQERLQDSEIAFVSLSQALECLDLGYKRDSHRISIRWERGLHGLKVYGTGISDINAIRVSRDALTEYMLMENIKSS
ncbi:hypothetical protein [Alicyclobacillus acidoterrestris]|uniref:Uncharacterized protein n=1 Tax=Alicyclobacillus acidoterrestris (strain ATCC 49025 / DSM 3922 / CIP 106132 / NCIMB 13137 / GD3B) TaxID=1356854 RepID=T0C2W1_ALIAG|nr:hypothetical protein [Alicyclobacillus acidoterrestris]EPZ47369.1 hypothetical protein N007_06480 [Alicyclobacillus acidoterrestris ATCC 49025]UNO49069.1 hypothetical protein K1I37_00425 [Alicyclobacillus acidoterrestris]